MNRNRPARRTEEQTAWAAARLTAAAVIGLFLGTFSAWLAIGFSSLYLLLLPVWALGFGLAFPRRLAMVATGALLAGNSLWATWPVPDPLVVLTIAIRTLISGGVALFGVTAVGNLLRTRRSPVRFAVVAAVFGAFFGWTLFLALPRWSHTYQVTVATDAPLEEVTLVLPMPMVEGRQHLTLLNEINYARPSGPHKVQARATEYGEMVELDMALASQDIPWAAPKPTGYRGNATFRDQGIGWVPDLEVGQRQDVGFILPHPFGIYGGPFKREKGRVTAMYETPMQVEYDRVVGIDVTLRVETAVWSFVSYAQEKRRYRSDEITAVEAPNGEWVLVKVRGQERIGLDRAD